MASVGAYAQTTKPMGLSVRAGIALPMSGYGRDIGRTWFGVGGEYKLKDANFGMTDRSSSGMLSISADYYGKGQASAVPVMLNYVAMQNEFFYSVGAGIAFTHDEELVAGIMQSRSATNFAYQFGLGYNFQSGSNPLFVEGKFFGNGNSRLNALGLFVGVRL
jgi:hypothetical protein